MGKAKELYELIEENKVKCNRLLIVVGALIEGINSYINLSTEMNSPVIKTIEKLFDETDELLKNISQRGCCMRICMANKD